MNKIRSFYRNAILEKDLLSALLHLELVKKSKRESCGPTSMKTKQGIRKKGFSGPSEERISKTC